MHPRLRGYRGHAGQRSFTSLPDTSVGRNHRSERTPWPSIVFRDPPVCSSFSSVWTPLAVAWSVRQPLGLATVLFRGCFGPSFDPVPTLRTGTGLTILAAVASDRLFRRIDFVRVAIPVRMHFRLMMLRSVLAAVFVAAGNALITALSIRVGQVSWLDSR